MISHRLTVSSEQIADNCDPHIMAVKSPNMRPSRINSRTTTRMKAGEWPQSVHITSSITLTLRGKPKFGLNSVFKNLTDPNRHW